VDEKEGLELVAIDADTIRALIRKVDSLVVLSGHYLVALTAIKEFMEGSVAKDKHTLEVLQAVDGSMGRILEVLQTMLEAQRDWPAGLPRIPTA